MISLITAEDLKSIATSYTESKNEKPFNLNYLLQIGIFNKNLVKF